MTEEKVTYNVVMLNAYVKFYSNIYDYVRLTMLLFLHHTNQRHIFQFLTAGDSMSDDRSEY